MVISILIYAVVTLVTLRYAAPWLTSGQVAFAAREDKVFMSRALSVVAITAIYVVLSILAGISSPLLAKLMIGIIGQPLAASLAYSLAFAAIDVLIMAVTIRVVAAVMKKSVKAETFGMAIAASLIITSLATFGQIAAAIAFSVG